MHPTIDDKKVKELIASFPDPQYDVPAPNSCRHKYYPEIAFIGAREPPRIIYPDPTIAQCVRHFEAYELGLIAITTAYTSYVGYQNAGPRGIRSGVFVRGVAFGLFAGFSYAYATCWSLILIRISEPAVTRHAASIYNDMTTVPNPFEEQLTNSECTPESSLSGLYSSPVTITSYIDHSDIGDDSYSNSSITMSFDALSSSEPSSRHTSKRPCIHSSR